MRPLHVLGFILLAAMAGAQEQTRIRVVASNLSTGNFQRYEQPGTNILKALKPDVVLMNEFSVEGGNLRHWVNTTFGPDYAFYVETGAQIPNGVVSRFPIIESGEYIDPFVSNRDFAWARINIPGERDLWAISVHFLTTSATNRNNQANELITRMLPALNIPANDYVILGGDFNTSNRTESALSTLRAKFTIASPYPADQNGNGNTNANRNSPYDWVVVSPNLHTLEVPFTFGTSSFPAGFVFDSRVFTQTQLNNFFPPVQVSDSGASGMQHMAVIRDFLVPVIGVDPDDPDDPDDPTGPGGEGPVYFFEDFEAISLTGAYTTGTFTASTGTWSSVAALREAQSGSCAGSAAIRINRLVSGASITTPALSQGIGTLTFSFREFSTNSGQYAIQTAADPQGPYTTVATGNFSGTVCQTARHSILETGTRYVRFLSDNQGGRLVVDNVSITSYSAPVTPKRQGWFLN